MLKFKILKFEWTGRNFKLYIDNEYSHTAQTERVLLADVINQYFWTGTLDPKKYSGLTEDGLVSRNATVAEMKEILNALDVEVIQSGAATILIWSE
jgi:hypothetical protein